MADHNALMDAAIGVVLTELSALPAMIGGMDLTLRRKCEASVFTVRTRIADEANRRADAAGEPKD